MKTTNRRNLFILIFTLLVVMLGFGMVIPVFPFLIDKLGASGSALGILIATASLTEFLFGPIWGSVSDRVGRKPIFVSVGRMAGPIVAGVIFDLNPNYPYLAGALILCIVFIMSLIWIKEVQPNPVASPKAL